jgi:hypothetical protein
MIREWLRKQILKLIERDIESIARHAYNDGCYVTKREMIAQKRLEHAALVRHNEALSEAIMKHLSVTMPEYAFTASAQPGLEQEEK